jgi:hypothetical protein
MFAASWSKYGTALSTRYAGGPAISRRPRKIAPASVVGLSLVVPDGVIVSDALTGEDIVRWRTEQSPSMRQRLARTGLVVLIG